MIYVSNGTTWGIQETSPWVDAQAAWTALDSGTAPAATLHAEAGSGAIYTSLGGSKLAFGAKIKTGASPVSGGILATFALVGYSKRPFVAVSPVDEASTATFPYVEATSSSLTLHVGGEIYAGTEYSYNLLVLGK